VMGCPPLSLFSGTVSIVSGAMPSARRLLGIGPSSETAVLRRALLDHREPPGQLAGAQQDRQVICRLDGEAARNLPTAAQDRLADDRRGDDLVVEHDRERLADILLRGLSELPGPVGIETKVDDRLAGARIEARLRIDDIAAGQYRALVDHIGQ